VAIDASVTGGKDQTTRVIVTITSSAGDGVVPRRRGAVIAKGHSVVASSL
jgi:hypothetical protein